METEAPRCWRAFWAEGQQRNGSTEAVELSNSARKFSLSPPVLRSRATAEGGGEMARLRPAATAGQAGVRANLPLTKSHPARSGLRGTIESWAWRRACAAGAEPQGMFSGNCFMRNI